MLLILAYQSLDVSLGVDDWHGRASDISIVCWRWSLSILRLLVSLIKGHLNVTLTSQIVISDFILVHSQFMAVVGQAQFLDLETTRFWLRRPTHSRRRWLRLLILMAYLHFDLADRAHLFELLILLGRIVDVLADVAVAIGAWLITTYISISTCFSISIHNFSAITMGLSLVPRSGARHSLI